MPQYMITKHLTAELIVECADRAEAEISSQRIVATIEDENGNQIPSKEFEEFEARVGIADTLIEEMPN